MTIKINQSGQGMTEYILIIALIAIAVIAAVRIFGGSVSSGFQSAANQINSNTSGSVANNAAGVVGNTVGNAANNAVSSVVGGH